MQRRSALRRGKIGCGVALEKTGAYGGLILLAGNIQRRSAVDCRSEIDRHSMG